jgi:cytochrome c oxidase assembly protein subunit 15
MVHRIVAVVILAGVVAAVFCSRRCQSAERAMARLSYFWLALIAVQIGLGAATIWSDKAADVATAHVLVGALALVTGAFRCIIFFAPDVTALCERRPEDRRSQTAATIGGYPALAGNK